MARRRARVRGPALPLGGATGIVYLHGAVGLDPDSLVLTDADFGRAYLTQGHARRFLVQLFSNNVVLFVGYSHRDTVLTYLARGLPPKVEPRFTLVDAGDVHRWEALAVEPVVYPTRSGRSRHITLAASLAEWGRDVAMLRRSPPQDSRDRWAWTGPRSTGPRLRPRGMGPASEAGGCGWR
jgi:hypothetical protein